MDNVTKIDASEPISQITCALLLNAHYSAQILWKLEGKTLDAESKAALLQEVISRWAGTMEMMKQAAVPKSPDAP